MTLKAAAVVTNSSPQRAASSYSAAFGLRSPKKIPVHALLSVSCAPYSPRAVRAPGRLRFRQTSHAAMPIIA
jgi:hypothetical protein